MTAYCLSERQKSWTFFEWPWPGVHLEGERCTEQAETAQRDSLPPRNKQYIQQNESSEHPHRLLCLYSSSLFTSKSSHTLVGLSADSRIWTNHHTTRNWTLPALSCENPWRAASSKEKTEGDMVSYIKIKKKPKNICNTIHYSTCWFIPEGLQSILWFPEPANRHTC